MMYVSFRFLFWLISLFYLPMKVMGRENIQKRGGFILAGNHVSYLDPIIFGIACPRSLNYMARDTLFKSHIFRWMLKKAHVFPLKQDVADFGAIKEALKRLKDGKGLVLFPEGTRSSDGRIGQGQEGVGFLARKSGVPVIPVYLDGTQKALPKGSKMIHRARLRVVFGRPMIFSKDDGLTDSARTERIMKHIGLLKNSLNF